MKKTFILLLLLLMVLTSASFAESPQSEEISIIFTHDMHAHFDPERTVINGETSERGGYARLKTAIDGVVSRYADTFILDAGDFAMGTPYQTIFSLEAAEYRMMGLLGYDAVTLGNHEFDFRARGIIDMLNAALSSGDTLPPVLMANIDWERTLADPSRAANAAELKPLLEQAGNLGYIIIEKGGVKAAVFGIMGKESDSYAPESGMYFKDIIESSKEMVAKIKSDGLADIIICLSHSGTKEDISKSEDEQLAMAVPELDVIISGHTHTLLTEPITIGNTLVVSSGDHGYQIGHLTLKRNGDRYTVSSYELIPINDSLEKNPDIESEILKFRELVNTRYLADFGYSFDQVLASTDFGFTPIDNFGKEQGEDTLGNLIADSYVQAIKKIEGDNYRTLDVAIVPSGLVRGSFSPGNITVADAFNVSSLGIGPDRVPGYPLVNLYLTGKELKTMAEIDISVSTLMSEARLYMSGLSYTYNPNRLLLNRVIDVKLIREDGSLEEVKDGELYRIVGSLYACQMMGAVEGTSYGLLKVTPKDVNGNPVTDFEANLIYDGNRELKEWAALAAYLSSFDKVDGVPKIPEYYNQTHGRKIEDNSRSPIAILKSPNKIFFIVAGVVLLILLIIFLPVFFIVRTVKRRKKGKRLYMHSR